MFDHECNRLKSINKKSMRMVNNSILKLLPVSGSDGGRGHFAVRCEKSNAIMIRIMPGIDRCERP